MEGKTGGKTGSNGAIDVVEYIALGMLPHRGSTTVARCPLVLSFEKPLVIFESSVKKGRASASDPMAGIAWP